MSCYHTLLDHLYTLHSLFYPGVDSPTPVVPPPLPQPPPQVITIPVALPSDVILDLTSKVSSRPSAGNLLGIGRESILMMLTAGATICVDEILALFCLPIAAAT